MFKFIVPMSRIVNPLTEGEGTPAPAPNPVPNPNPPPTPAPGKTFTQDEVNAMMAKERKTLTDKISEHARTQKLTEDQAKSLEAQLEEIKSMSLTEKEKAAIALKKITDEAAKKTKDLEDERNLWQDRFNRSGVKTSLTQASVKHEAYNPEQVHAILAGKSRMAPILGEDGKPTGEFATKVKLQVKGTDGALKELDLDPDEAVKILKEMPEFANLFKGTQTPGLGGNNGSPSKKGPADYKNMSMEDYKKNRNKK